MTREKDNLPEGDDGRTIANMNVEGMPWYAPEKEDSPQENPAGTNPYDSWLTDEEARIATWGALKAALLVVGVICLGIVLFILFCTTIWFR